MKIRPKGLFRLVLILGFLLLAGRMLVIAWVTPSAPMVPRVPSPKFDGTERLREYDSSWARRKAGILQVHLKGSPERIGKAHASLLRPEMLRNEKALWDVFESFVPFGPLRAFLMDAVRIRYRSIDRSLGFARREELAASSQAFSPDPFIEKMPTYARFLMLNSLYDVSLSFEHSPLIGCSSLYLAEDGPLLGRNFDFETHEVFDEDKAVILFEESGKTPVFSVAWPGFVGVVTGMNGAGVAAVVHGARAGKASTEGEPVAITVREALANAQSAEEAAQWVAERNPMVPHLVLIADSEGKSVVVERVPGRPAHRRAGATTLALTNHFEGPSADDPANIRVRDTTSTLQRRDRLDSLLKNRSQPLGPRDVVGVLRDRHAADGAELPPGDRRAIDADIATHGVVMDLGQRVMWVSKGPHLSGGFVRFNLRHWLDDPQSESQNEAVEVLPPD